MDFTTENKLKLLKLLINRKDVFAEQQDNGSYFPIKRKITKLDLIQHIKGLKTIASYCLDTDNKISWACVDIDGTPDTLKKNLTISRIIYDGFKEFPRILEFSGRKGYHIWIFFKPKITASYGKKLIKTRLKLLDLDDFEVFPKQTTLNPNRLYGNSVKLPFAFHKVSKQYSKIIKRDLKNYTKDNIVVETTNRKVFKPQTLSLGWVVGKGKSDNHNNKKDK